MRIAIGNLNYNVHNRLCFSVSVEFTLLLMNKKNPAKINLESKLVSSFDVV